MSVLTLFFFVSLVAAASRAAGVPHQIHLLRPVSGAGGHHIPGVSCQSWRLAVETNNLQKWTLVPEVCENYVGHYMLGHQYRKDCNAVVYAAVQYAKGLKVAGNGKDIWIFDIDETSLSNLPYFAREDVAFGAKAYNSTAFNEWVLEGKAPALPPVLLLYNELVHLGYKIVFISGRTESQRQATESNLKNVGYHSWEKLILKQTSESSTTAVVYKSSKRKALEASGFRIIGNVGDQWSDLLGTHVGNRTFKVPDPMYYIS